YLALQVIFHSPICPESLKKEIKRMAVARKYHKPEKVPAQPRYFPVLLSIDSDSFLNDLAEAAYAESIATELGKTS
ncbi:MAG: hypothetical protein ACE5I0_10085, partial [Candidatus Binatia bacterium]